LTAAVAALGALVASWPLLRSLVPNVLYEPPKKFRIGAPASFQEGVTFLEEHRIFLFRESSNFHAVSGICTHLGCTVKFSPFTLPQEETVRDFTYRALGEFHWLRGPSSASTSSCHRPPEIWWLTWRPRSRAISDWWSR
jgi:Rieske Fe-S protein